MNKILGSRIYFLLISLIVFTTNIVAMSNEGETRCLYPDGKSSLYETSLIIKNVPQSSKGVKPEDIIETCEFGSTCIQYDSVNNGKAHCARSVKNESSPYRDFGCSFKDYISFPTTLEADCRCRYTGDSQGGKGGKGSRLANPNDTNVKNGARPGGPVINCSSGSRQLKAQWPIRYGKGPKFDAWYLQSKSGASWFSGVFNESTREVFGLVRWSNPKYSRAGTIVAWNIDTKDRRVVSGLYPDRRRGQKEFGSGYKSPKPLPKKGTQILTNANTMRLGTDGMLYILGSGEGSSSQVQITKVDPMSGERTLVWEAMNKKYTGNISDTFGQCFRPNAFKPNTQSVNIMWQAFEVGPNGDFYLSMRDKYAGDGILKISADGSKCTPLSVWGSTKGHKPGGGKKPAPAYAHLGEGKGAMQFPVQGLLYYDDPEYGPMILGVSNNNLYSFSIKDGFRSLESFDNTVFKGMGHANMFFENRNGHRIVWAVGNHERFSGAIVELGTGRREPIYGDTKEYKDPILKSDYGVVRSVMDGTMLSQSNSIGNGVFIIDPKNPNLAYYVMKHGALGVLELSTFNNMVHSY